TTSFLNVVRVYMMLRGVLIVVLFFFFFSSRRRHTRFSRDWSSDVCSSDLEFHSNYSNPMKTLIVDDERLARIELRRLLQDFPKIDIVGEAANADEALELIEELEPDLLFLD